MTAVATQEEIQILNVAHDVKIDAPIGVVFETLLEAEPRSGLNLKIEAWPGGRWYRDLGNNTGHLWGHVQVIKPPKLLEIWGPMMMSFPAVNHRQYRLTAEGTTTRLQLTHRAMGLLTSQHREGMPEGWGHWMNRIRDRAERRAKAGAASSKGG